MTTNSRLQFRIDHAKEKAGWIPCQVTLDGVSHSFDASRAIPPFLGLLDFLRLLTLMRLPADFFWDEEGYGPYFEAWPVDRESAAPGCDFHLRIIHDDRDFHWFGEGEEQYALVNSYQVLWVDADLNSQEVVDIFLLALRDYLLYGQKPEEWGFAMADMAAFEQLRARDVPPRSDITQATPIDLILTRWQEAPDPEEDTMGFGSQNLEVRIWDQSIENWSFDDSDPSWPLWFELLECALNGQSISIGFQDMFLLRLYRDGVADGSVTLSEAAHEHWTRIDIRPLPHPHHVRLRIYDNQRYPNFLRMDEVIDLTQWTRLFVKEFEDLLNENYQPYPDEDGITFDLRTLPLARLKESLAQR